MGVTDHVIGIDFGTSTSLLAQGLRGQSAVLQPIGRSQNEMPSTVGLKAGRLVVGEDAEDLPITDFRRSIKRAITEQWTDIWLGRDRERSVDADVAIMNVLQEIGDRTAELGLPLDDENIRLSCPASWTGTQRARLLNLAANAGLSVGDHTLIDEPVAAGIAWVVHQTESERVAVKGKVLIFDMGGGTVDVAHLDVDAEPGRQPVISVLSSVGLNEAGDRLDEDIANDLLDDYRVFQHLAEVPESKALISAAHSAAAEAKRELSTQTVVWTELSAPGWQRQIMALTRERLEELFAPQWERAAQKVWECLRASTLTYRHHEGMMAARKLPLSKLAADVDHVVLVGGMSQIPMIRARIDEMFPSAHVHQSYGVSPTEAVVAGLSETSYYENISFHRPAYDFILRFDCDGNTAERRLYEAYEPLYNFAIAMTNDDPKYEMSLRDGLPRRGSGKIFIQSSAGTPVGINYESKPLDGIPVELGDRGVRLRLKPNGDVLVVDGRDNRWEARVTGWPAIRGSEDLAIIMRRKLGSSLPEPDNLGHMHNNRYG